MRRFPGISLVLVCLLGVALAGPPLTEEELSLQIASFDEIWITVRDEHFDPEIGGVDWEGVRTELRPRIEAATTLAETGGILREMISRVQGTHFFLIPAEVFGEGPAANPARGGQTGIDLRVLEGHALVTSVHHGSPAAKAGVRPGWEIVEAGGEELAPRLQSTAKAYFGSMLLDYELACAAGSRLVGSIGDRVSVRFLDGNDRAVELEIPLGPPRGRKLDRKPMLPAHWWLESHRVEETVGVIAFNGFIDPLEQMRAFNAAVESCLDAEGIVLDLRGNAGGLGAMTMWMAGWFVKDEGASLGIMKARDYELRFAVTPRARTYDGPLVILVDGLSLSASEALAGGLKDLGRACIVGSRTAGASQPASVLPLSNGDRFVHATASHLSELGEIVEGLGVFPDIEVRPTREALLEGRDLALEAAIAWIRDPAPLLALDERRLNLEAFDKAWTTIRDRHFDPDLGGLDWDAVREELRPLVAQASTTEAAREPMREMIHRLGHSHVNVIPKELYEEIGPAGDTARRDGTAGITARVINGQATVLAVAEESPAAAAGVRPGWEIVRVGDRELAPVLEEIGEEFAGKSWQSGVMSGYVQERLDGPKGESRRVLFRDGSGAEIERELTLAEAPGHKVQFGFLPEVRVRFVSRPIGDDIGYVTWNMFLDLVRVMPAFEKALTEFRDARGIVIDLRGNPGGMLAMVTGLAGWLLDEEGRHLGTMHFRETELRLVVNPRPETYAGKVAVLVDELSGSASELFSGGLKDVGRARVFGRTTLGAALPSEIMGLPNGDGLQFVTANYVSASGRVLEGAGVVPNRIVVPTREQLLAGRDPVLEAAIEWIRTNDEN